MKYIVLLAFAVLVLLPSAYARSNQDQTKVINVTTTVVGVRQTPGALRVGTHRTTRYLLWNLQESSKPIGYALLSCMLSGTDGVFSSKPWICNGIYILPRGKIVSLGSVFNFRQYTLAVTGGTRLYVNAGGASHQLYRDLSIRYTQ